MESRTSSTKSSSIRDSCSLRTLSGCYARFRKRRPSRHGRPRTPSPSPITTYGPNLGPSGAPTSSSLPGARALELAERIEREHLVRPWYVRWIKGRTLQPHYVVGRHPDSDYAVALGMLEERPVV